MQDRRNYIAWKEHEDKFACLDKDFKITVWSKTTGKHIRYEQEEIKATDNDVKDFEIFSPNPEDLSYKRNYMNNC
jgi:hypothetical protein